MMYVCLTVLAKTLLFFDGDGVVMSLPHLTLILPRLTYYSCSPFVLALSLAHRHHPPTSLSSP